MKFASGLELWRGQVLIFPDDKYVSKVEAGLKISLVKMKQHQGWQDFQDYVTFYDDDLYRETSDRYRSRGDLVLEINFEDRMVTDVNNNMRLQIVQIIEIKSKGAKIVTIAGLFITKKMAASFATKARSVVKSPSTSLPLTRDAFIVIARNSDPRDVARLCATNNQLLNFCTPEFYRDMLWHHFGQKSDDPRKTFFHLIRHKVFGCGSDHYGQLGLGRKLFIEEYEDLDDYEATFEDDDDDDTYSVRIPIVIDLLLPSIKAVCAGNAHSLFLDVKGQVWGCGSNYNREIGIPKNIKKKYVTQPTLITRLKNIVAISTKFHHSLFLDSDGNVFGCGDSSRGQIRLPKKKVSENRSVLYKEPVLIPELLKIKAVSAGQSHSLFLDVEDRVWGSGSNDSLQINLPEPKARGNPALIPGLPKIKAVSAGQYHSLFLDFDGRVWECGTIPYGSRAVLEVPINIRGALFLISGLPKIAAISAGYNDNSLFLDVEGKVWVVRGKKKNPVLIEELPKIKAISEGYRYSLFLDFEGRVWAFGNTSYGKLGLDISQRENSYHTPQMIKTLSNITAISAGADHSLFLN